MSGLGTVGTRYDHRLGDKTGMLTLVGIADRRSDSNRMMGIFHCDCGKEVVFPAGRVLNGNKRTHCGCKTDRGAHRTHGMRYSSEYSSWGSMKGRCLDKNNKDYPRWGGRGITVFLDWIDSFEAFYEHVGQRPRGTTLDRINNTKGYEPGNVRWATPSQQQRNRRNTYVWHIKGVIFQTNSEAASYYNVSEHTVWRWVKGQLDARRKTFTNPRRDCYVISRY